MQSCILSTLLLINEYESVQVVISHLKQQLADARVDTEQLALLGVTKAALSEQVAKLTDELCEAKTTHTPV